jgi:hypothetical protein
MADRNSRTGGSSVRSVNRRGGLPGERIIASIILGIALLVSAGMVTKQIKALSATIGTTPFADTNSFYSPSELTYVEKTYLDQDEAAAYLHMSAAEIAGLIADGEIDEYVRTDNGFTISKKALDAWFDNEAYQNIVSGNTNDTE